MLVAVVGQTASGKSSLAIDLATVLGGSEGSAIIGIDAMQLYTGLDVGTAKTPVQERLGIPHYQIDQLDVEDEAAVATYQAKARLDVKALQSSGKQVIAAGGSGLYARALLDHMVFPGADENIRAKLNRELEEYGANALHARLDTLDPQSAKTIHPNNGRRIVRALEVIQLTGKPFAATLPQEKYYFPQTLQLAIRWNNELLDQRINLRTEKMFAEGILEETAALLEAGRIFGRTAAKATGYEQALAVLRGEMEVSDAVQEVSLATRQLARRQMKWFKRDERIVWLEPKSSVSLVEQALHAIELGHLS